MEPTMSMNRTTRLILAVMALSALGVLAGCDDDPASPGIQPEISNGADSFEFQVSSVRNYTGTLTYTWNNASATASVDHSCAVNDGTARLRITDGDGATVYDRSLAQDGSFETSAGAAGDWTLTVALDGMSGDLNFRADEGS
jgi:hypothetical protein